MRIRQLQCFVVLAEELSFTRAAIRLNMSQPPLSTQIQTLEREIEAQLILRTSRKVALTDAGRAFLGHARSILEQYQRAMREMAAIRQGQEGLLEIGATGSILRGGLSDLLARFSARYPGISLHVTEQPPSVQITEVISHRTDVSFNRSIPRSRDLAHEFAWSEEMVALLPQEHPLAGRAAVSIADLRHDPHVLLRPDSSDFATYLLSRIIDAGYHPKISQQVVDAQSIPALIAAGFGVSIVPAGIARLTAGPLVFLPIRPEPPVSQVYMVYRRHEQSPALLTFLAHVRAGLKDATE